MFFKGLGQANKQTGREGGRQGGRGRGREGGAPISVCPQWHSNICNLKNRRKPAHDLVLSACVSSTSLLSLDVIDDGYTVHDMVGLGGRKANPVLVGPAPVSGGVHIVQSDVDAQCSQIVNPPGPHTFKPLAMSSDSRSVPVAPCKRYVRTIHTSPDASLFTVDRLLQLIAFRCKRFRASSASQSRPNPETTR